ncbi:hydroxymethylglutaryl-CoA synthase [Siminovitchia terrae]|uniref:Hydroxymethylglutaryl-CoA synthase n=1 Tax=Siminovitchia terrae TaxID=1914933 RepID=A0ABQ4L3H7_SIMTE|nr:3-oxoacyl-[acyl-carrier-protein] synthase III C-terminal domain-containing protein [Siminovitchia terrae]GIN98430.1 hydroxymethylglutaryl-CoA synthase [Siminovitchia terrae]
MTDIGIVDIGIKVPFNKVKYEEIITTWGNSSPLLLENTIGIKSRGVTDYDEDIITLAMDSIDNMREAAQIPKIDCLSFGTTSQVDLIRPNSVILQQGTGIPNEALIYDVHFSEKSGTTALVNSILLLHNEKIKSSLVVAADTLNMYTSPGDLRETYMGAGGASLLLGKENTILNYVDSHCYTSYFPSNFKPYDERFIRSGLPLGAEKNNYGEIKHLKDSIEGLLNKNSLTINDISKFVFPSLPVSLLQMLLYELQITNDQYINTNVFSRIGDTGSPSPFIELRETLPHLNSNELIVLLGYGSGAGADAVLFKTTERVSDYRKDSGFTNGNNSVFVKYGETLKMENKLVSPNIKQGPFL